MLGLLIGTGAIAGWALAIDALTFVASGIAVMSARTVRAWEAEILAWHATGGCSNGPTEALNLLIKKINRGGALPPGHARRVAAGAKRHPHESSPGRGRSRSSRRVAPTTHPTATATTNPSAMRPLASRWC